MARRGKLTGFICLALGVADLGLLNLVLVPAAWPPAAPKTTVDLRPAPTAPAPARPPALEPAPARVPAGAAAAPPALDPALADITAAPADEDSNLLVIRFATNRMDLSHEERKKLLRLVARLRRSPQLRLRVDGHSDQRGEPDHNKRLSMLRARNVTAALVAAGIAPRRITTQAHGAARPESPGNRPGTWIRNRRVEITVLGEEAP